MNKKLSPSQIYIKNLAKNKGKFLKVKIVPSSPKTSFIAEMADGSLKVAVAAPPEKNRANQELLVFLAAVLDVDVKDVQIVSGASARRKLLKINYQA